MAGNLKQTIYNTWLEIEIIKKIWVYLPVVKTVLLSTFE